MPFDDDARRGSSALAAALTPYDPDGLAAQGRLENDIPLVADDRDTLQFCLHLGSASMRPSRRTSMRRLVTFVLGLLVGGSVVYSSLKYHIVRAGDGFHLIPKLTAEFSQTYVDIRQYDLNDWAQHQALAIALTRAGQDHLLRDAAMGGLRDAVDELFRLPRKDQ
jgi:hypothetical protein